MPGLIDDRDEARVPRPGRRVPQALDLPQMLVVGFRGQIVWSTSAAAVPAEAFRALPTSRVSTLLAVAAVRSPPAV